MFKKLFIFTSLFSAIAFSPYSSALNDKLMLKKEYPSSYIVKPGDTLWDISALFLDDPWVWPKLWEINPDINNPHLIYPGDKLSMTWQSGHPILTIKPLKKISPQIRTLVKTPVPTLNHDLIVPYLQSDKLIDAVSYQQAYRVLGTSDGRQFLSANERVYVDAELSHRKWGIYRIVGEFTRSDTKQVSYALRSVAVAELTDVSEKISGLKVVKQHQEIAINDMVLPIASSDISSGLITTFPPSPAPENIKLSILGSIHGGKYLAVNQVAVVDRGSNDGIQQGNMFSLKENGHVVKGKKGEYFYDLNKGDSEKGIQLPQVTIGELIIIRPYEAFSLALITRSETVIHQDTIVLSSPVSFLNKDKK
ncbi:LysM peptidoglycan-binding domain-containing protein [uncultured Aliivibrio sp.]|uniref:LysM peptidoglycan-binding domain-containing protein n=1 Tax=uncultured Aliivibrio sp. TaxID=873085 RepID=UPI002626E29A|nr:LysM peptidoglycan-binding domain-containing protein [uncultured Aliivibrio sp.]